MNSLIYKIFYGLPLHKIIEMMILLVGVWWILAWFSKRTPLWVNIWKIANSLLFIGMMIVIFVLTIISRNEGTELILIPFYSFVEAQTQPELYRSMLMNVFLFFPLGLTLPYALPGKWKHQVLFTILFAFIFSVAIEWLQYHFSLGRAEVDDVLCNTLGCAIGTLSFRKDDKTVNETL